MVERKQKRKVKNQNNTFLIVGSAPCASRNHAPPRFPTRAK